MKSYIINEPIWNGGNWAVGIAEFRILLKQPLKIYYKKKPLIKGKFLAPKTAFSYPQKIVGNGVALRIIPIGDLICQEPRKTN